MSKGALRGVGIGAGYFSRFQYEAWARIPEARSSASTTAHARRRRRSPRSSASAVSTTASRRCWTQRSRTSSTSSRPRRRIWTSCASRPQRGVHIICQKPLAPTYDECVEIVETAKACGVRFMVHENWRWQPWYREIKRLLDDGVLGEVFSVYFRMRMGDGWHDDAYLARQPFFRDYPRLLIFETGVHFLDTFRYLLGEMDTRLCAAAAAQPGHHAVRTAGSSCSASRAGRRRCWTPAATTRTRRTTRANLRRDAHRRAQGSPRTGLHGRDPHQAAGRGELRARRTQWTDRGFAGDCVYALQRHFVERMSDGAPFESTGEDYLRTVRAMEACYASAAAGQVVRF